jgi:hypothetical protein
MYPKQPGRKRPDRLTILLERVFKNAHDGIISAAITNDDHSHRPTRLQQGSTHHSVLLPQFVPCVLQSPGLKVSVQLDERGPPAFVHRVASNVGRVEGGDCQAGVSSKRGACCVFDHPVEIGRPDDAYEPGGHQAGESVMAEGRRTVFDKPLYVPTPIAIIRVQGLEVVRVFVRISEARRTTEAVEICLQPMP